MSSVILKLIAVVTMLLDHTAASCFRLWGISRLPVPFLDGITVYWLGRMIGRIAFPIYCFLIVEGVHHTRDWKRYGLRLLVLALLSEFPFDFGLHGLRADLGQPDVPGQLWESIDWQHQNVFFTLLLGMLAVQFLKATQQMLVRYQRRQSPEGGEQTAFGFSAGFAALAAVRYGAWAGLTFGLGYFAKYVLHTDYGMGGVVMISMMGLIYEYWEDIVPWLPQRILRTAICGLALWSCCRILNSSIEIYGMFALIPIALYNGKKGYSGKALQYGFYLFYPVHLLALGILAVCSGG